MIQTKTVDITPMKITLPVIEMSQYDLGREVIIHMKDGSDWFDLTGYTAKLQGTKPSGFGYTVDGVVDGHDITFASNYDMTSEAGFIPSEVRLTKDGVSLGSLNLILHVEKTPHDVTVTDGSPETIIPEMTELVERAEAAAEVLLDCSATATTLPTGSSATASYDVEEGVFTFGIPRGATGAKGDTGVGISTIQKTSSSGPVDTYTITFTDSSTTTFTVTNGDDGNGIVSITKTGTSGLVDTYTITYTNGTTSTYTVTNGRDGTGSGTVTSIATGKGLTGGTITSSGTIKANLVSETNSTQASQTITQVAGRQYAVNPDANGKLSVNVPWDGGANVQSDWTQADTTADDYIKNKPTLATVATTGDYDDLSNKPDVATAELLFNESADYTDNTYYKHVQVMGWKMGNVAWLNIVVRTNEASSSPVALPAAFNLPTALRPTVEAYVTAGVRNRTVASTIVIATHGQFTIDSIEADKWYVANTSYITAT